jgi:transketolase
MPYVHEDLDELSVNTIRTLAADVVFKSNSGHPGESRRFPLSPMDIMGICFKIYCSLYRSCTGAPMGMAPVAHVLFSRCVWQTVTSLDRDPILILFISKVCEREPEESQVV